MKPYHVTSDVDPRQLRQELKKRRDQWLKSYRVPGKATDTSVYILGIKAIRYVADMMHEKPKTKEAPRGQIRHFLGLNEILVRLIERDRDAVKSWLSTVEATDFLVHQYEKKGLELKRNNFRPDGWVKIGKNSFWIEFDNETEGPRKLENKFHDIPFHSGKNTCDMGHS